MTERKIRGTRKHGATAVRRIDLDLPVNRTITLDSAKNPAEPPKGNKWAQRNRSETDGKKDAETGRETPGN